MFKIENGYKTYNKNNVLKNINLNFEDGKVYGLVGINGCGKTLILKALSGYIKLDKGVVYQDDTQLRTKNNYVTNTGVLIENPEFISHLTLSENFKELIKIYNKDIDIEKWIKIYELEEYKNTKFKHLSLGTKKKMALIQAFMHDPNNLIFDEPMNALDELSVKKTKNLIKENIEKNQKVIVLTSHHAQDIEDLCDVVIHIENGEVKKIDTNTTQSTDKSI